MEIWSIGDSVCDTRIGKHDLFGFEKYDAVRRYDSWSGAQK